MRLPSVVFPRLRRWRAGHLLTLLALLSSALGGGAVSASAGTGRPAGGADAAVARTRAEEEKAQTAFLARLNAVLGEHFGEAEARIPDTLNRLADTGGMVKLVCRMAADQVRGTDTAGEAVAAVIGENLGAPCGAGAAAAEELLAGYRHELAALDNGLRAALAAPLGPALPAFPGGADGGPGRLDRVDLEQQARTLALRTVLNELSLAVDAITLEVIRPMLSKVVLRIATGAGLTAA